MWNIFTHRLFVQLFYLFKWNWIGKKNRIRKIPELGENTETKSRVIWLDSFPVLTVFSSLTICRHFFSLTICIHCATFLICKNYISSCIIFLAVPFVGSFCQTYHFIYPHKNWSAHIFRDLHETFGQIQFLPRTNFDNHQK